MAMPNLYELQIYVTYPDSFEIDGQRNLYTLKENVQRINELGFNAIHVLPFLESPQIDAGFDVSGYKEVREALGGNKAFDEILNETKKYNMSVFMDLVVNHTSNQHEWFKKAISGDQFFRDFYIHTKEKPNYIETFKNEDGCWAKYDIGGTDVDIRIIFPEQVGEIPHWTWAEDEYWYYHTFYPQQPDLNWHNDHVFEAFFDILSFWANKDLNFRLDAVPFLGKNLNQGIIESDDFAHATLKKLKKRLLEINKNSLFLVEALQPDKKTHRYLNNSEDIQADLAYNFPLTMGIWASLMDQNAKHIYDALEYVENTPYNAQWVTFLRNHDQLSFEYSNQAQANIVTNALTSKGLPFMNGFGISGRTASFLGEDSTKVILAYFILASLPGAPALIYGDELGKVNDIEFMNYVAERKKNDYPGERTAIDTRDINRGFIKQADFDQNDAKSISQNIARIFNTRKEYPQIAKGEYELLHEGNESLLGVEYRSEKTTVRTYVNLGETTLSLDINLKEWEIILKIGSISSNNIGKNSGVWLKKKTGD